MLRQQVEHFVAFLDTAADREALAENHLVLRVMQLGAEHEFAPELHCDRPAGERAGDFLHVLLRVAAIDAERMQLHELARIVLIESLARPAYLLRAAPARQSLVADIEQGATRAVGLAPPVVEIEQHCRTARDGTEEVAELAHRPGTDHVAIVFHQEQPLLRALLREDGEVILPERDHHFIELSLADHRAGEQRRLKLRNGALKRLDRLSLAVVLALHLLLFRI